MVKDASNLVSFYDSHMLCETDWLGVGKEIKEIYNLRCSKHCAGITIFSQQFLQVFVSNSVENGAFGQVESQNQVSGKSLSKRFVKLQNFFEFLNVDHMDVTVGEGTDVNRGFGYGVIPPARITKNVTFSKKSQNFTILLE